MTALTWREMKRRARCDCKSADRAVCGRWVDTDAAPCKCQCHTYQRDAASDEQPGTERAT